MKQNDDGLYYGKTKSKLSKHIKAYEVSLFSNGSNAICAVLRNGSKVDFYRIGLKTGKLVCIKKD